MAKVLALKRNSSVSSSHSNSSNKTITRSSPSAASNVNTRATSRKSSSSLRTVNPESQDKYIKIILKRFKRIEITLGKFNSKHHGTPKTNILRTTLLPFLRSEDALDITRFGPKVHKSLISVGTSIMKRWWTCLLNLLVSNSQSAQTFSSIDRSAYLECISRIISRSEWFYVDEDLFENYKELLCLTLDYSIQRLQTIKIIPLSISAFIGKVFAYSFFTLPRVGQALLFLLNVKQSVFEKTVRPLNIKVSDAQLASLKARFPRHLHFLINYKGLPNLTRKQSTYVNCIPPPQHPVPGIKEPNGSWVRRWFNSDGDVFNSFLRHYVNITQVFLDTPEGDISNDLLLCCPGFNVVYSHISQIFSVSITRIASDDSSKYPGGDVNSRLPEMNRNKSPSPPQPPQNDIYYNSIMKILRTFRDIHFSNLAFKKNLVLLLDNILITLAKQNSIHDFSRNSLIFNIIYEFSNHVDGVYISWEFWLSCTYMTMKNIDHIQILLKNIAFLFNVWETIPDLLSEQPEGQEHLAWIKDKSKSYKENFIDWLISDETWERFFIHWHPIVRSYYIRLILWRVVGINNFESSIRIKITKQVEKKLAQSHSKFTELFQNKFSGINSRVSFKPDNPLVNRKFCISKITNRNDYLLIEETNNDISNTLTKPSELRKTHPFEIFDEAVYSCSSLPKPEEGDTEESRRSNSLVNSISKLFKLLSTEEKGGEEAKPFTQSSKSMSFSSLSTHSAKSRSSSPSLLSFKSTPTSLTDLSGESAFSSEASSFDLDSSGKKPGPPELFKVPPEIVRPLYKFDVVVDTMALRDKYYLMNNKSGILGDKEHYTSPQRPKVPTISIFINLDSYNRFYISNENLIMSDEDFGIDFPTDSNLFDHSSTMKQADYINLGKSLFEWNQLVDEFEDYLVKKVEIDQFSDNVTDTTGNNKISEFEYFKKITPFLSVDSSNEAKMLIAA